MLQRLNIWYIFESRRCKDVKYDILSSQLLVSLDAHSIARSSHSAHLLAFLEQRAIAANREGGLC